LHNSAGTLHRRIGKINISPHAAKVDEPREFGFCLAVSFSNCMGYLLATVPLTVVDRLLQHHVRFGSREYPHGWLIYPIAAVLLGGTFVLMCSFKTRLLRLVIATATLLLVYLVSVPLFPPEIPNSNLVGVGGLWIGITVGWVLIRYFLFHKDIDVLAKLDKDVQMQFIVQQLDFSKALFLGLVGVYIGLIVTWFHEVHLFNRMITTDAGEAILLDVKFTLDAVVISLFYAFGPLLEAVKQRYRLSMRLLEIPKTPEGCEPAASTG
jgi:hypothetical protein